MANSLGRDIEQGEVVVIRANKFRNKGMPAEERAFICSGQGFGMYDDTNGTALFGEWYDGSGEGRVAGVWIAKRETAQFQKQVGRFPHERQERARAEREQEKGE